MSVVVQPFPFLHEAHWCQSPTTHVFVASWNPAYVQILIFGSAQQAAMHSAEVVMLVELMSVIPEQDVGQRCPPKSFATHALFLASDQEVPSDHWIIEVLTSLPVKFFEVVKVPAPAVNVTVWPLSMNDPEHLFCVSWKDCVLDCCVQLPSKSVHCTGFGGAPV